MNHFKRLLRRIFRYRFWIVVTLLCAAVSVVMSLRIPQLVGDAIDCISPDSPENALSLIIGYLLRSVVCAVIGALAVWCMSTVNNRIAYGVVQDLRRDAFRKFQTLPLSVLDTVPRGEILSRMISDADTFSEGLLLGFTQLFTGVLTILGTLVIMLTIHPLIALAVIVLTPLSLLTARFIAKRTHDMFTLQSTIRAEQTAYCDEMITGQKVVRAFGYESHSRDTFTEINDRLEKASLRATFFSSLVNPSTRFINALVYAVVALFGGLAVLASGGSALSVGGLTCLLSYAGQYAKPFNEISGVIAEMQNALTCADRVLDFLDLPDQSPDGTNVLQNVRGEFDMRHVDFSYVPERPLIRDLNLQVKQEQKIAIVGPTGCGKTTLINLLLRFYDVCGGEILLDGSSLNEVTRHSLRTNIGMVLQETWLRHATVAQNIAVGRPDASREEIERAARAASAHSFIRRLPNGYDTVLSEDGEGLSQGQKQLLCIARIMLCLPPVLILDEATSSIDVRTEQKIQAAFDRLTDGKTSFIVAHRLSTIRSADLILVMRDGNIVETGNHEQLLARGGFYAKLYRSQFEQ